MNYECLPEDMSTALQGLHKQAGVACSMLFKKGMRGDLVSAHQMMSKRPSATRLIIKYVKDMGTTVPDVTPEALLAWLHEKDDLHIYHLKPGLVYFSALRRVGETDVYFTTPFWGDVEACGGMSGSIDEAEDMHRQALEPDALILCPPESVMHKDLLKDCLRPELVARVYLCKSERAN